MKKVILLGLTLFIINTLIVYIYFGCQVTNEQATIIAGLATFMYYISMGLIFLPLFVIISHKMCKEEVPKFSEIPMAEFIPVLLLCPIFILYGMAIGACGGSFGGGF